MKASLCNLIIYNIMHNNKKKLKEIILLFFTNIPGFRTTAYVNEIIIVTSIKPAAFFGF